MNNVSQHQNPASNTLNVLPQEPSMALNMLIRLTNNLSVLADREAQALAQNDMVTFAILQDEKILVTEQYVAASEEFRSKLNTYRGADSSLLDRLERLQRDLGEKTKGNNEVVRQIYGRAQNRTQSALLTAQELGQNHKLRERPAVNENADAKNRKTGETS
ncbi:MAG TPA: hypothetical protein PK513_07265 [Alphaproteobacteria bacterium]|nr:MAG: hypothetical protein H6859_05700 [Rhodospirillales bacterium]HOO82285.1 hypothetical protein [Alphaproteobacteria bacterium]